MNPSLSSDLAGNAVRTSGAWLPRLAGCELAFYLDHCGLGFRSGPLWWDRWTGAMRSSVWTLGADAGRFRLRLVLQRFPSDWSLF